MICILYPTIVVYDRLFDHYKLTTTRYQLQLEKYPDCNNKESRDLKNVL